MEQINTQQYYCTVCECGFTRKSFLTRHYNSKKHILRTKNNEIKVYKCDCGKSYLSTTSLHLHKKTCYTDNIEVDTDIDTTIETDTTITTNSSTIEKMKIELEKEREILNQERIELKKECEILKESFEREREGLKEQIALLLEKTITTNNHSTTHNNTNSHNTTNNIGTQINIINAFGHENLDYLDDKTILKCIQESYKCIPAMVEKIHFNPKHPENHNIKITNKKLPYASIMDSNRKWKLIDRKDAIEKMIVSSYEMLDDTYREKRDKVTPRKQERFESFQEKFGNDDKTTLRNVKNDVELLILNGV